MGIKSCFLLFLIIGFISCKTKDDAGVPNEYAAKFVQQLNPTNTFLYDFAPRRRGQFDSLRWRSINSYENLLGLPSLENGYDSIQIRVKFVCYLGIKEKLIILKNTKGRWSAEISEVYSHYTPNKSEEYSLSRKVVFQNPKSGWKNFIITLFDLNILTTEDGTKMPEYDPGRVTDGCEIGFWIATKNTYRYYEYDNPDIYAEENKQAATVVAIQKLLYQEFPILKKWDEENEKSRKKEIEKKIKKLNAQPAKKVILTEVEKSKQ